MSVAKGLLEVLERRLYQPDGTVNVAVDGEIVYINLRRYTTAYPMINRIIMDMGGVWHQEGKYWYVPTQFVENYLKEMD